MTKKEMKAIADKYNMDILRDPITSEFMCLGILTKEYIPELDALIDKCDPCSIAREDGWMYEETGSMYYSVYCPGSWFDLWGWK